MMRNGMGERFGAPSVSPIRISTVSTARWIWSSGSWSMVNSIAPLSSGRRVASDSSWPM